MTLDFSEHGDIKLTKDEILARVSDEAIYKKFCSKFPSSSFPSPFRKDSHPSFGFYKRGGRWLWKDLGGNGDAGDVFDYVARSEKTDFKGAMQIIAEQFHIRLSDLSQRVLMSKSWSEYPSKDKERTLIQAVRRPFTQPEYDWWNRIRITPQLLEGYLVRAAQEIWMRKPDWQEKKLMWENQEGNPIYYFRSSYSDNIKAYRPEEPDKSRKWLSNQNPLTDIQGYAQCRIKLWPGRPLLLVKSMKEVMFMRTFGLNAMSNIGEHVLFNADFIRHIKKYCFPILYLGDNDWPGMRALLKHEVRNEIPGLIIPRKWGSKDPTDLWLANYRKVYDLLNLIYDYFKIIRASTFCINSSKQLRHSGEANQTGSATGFF